MSHIGVRGLAPGTGEERVLVLERLPAIQARPGAPYVTKMRVRVEGRGGVVLAELTVNEGTFLTAVRRLFEEEIRQGIRRLSAQARALAGRGGQAAPAGPPAGPTQIAGIDVREWAKVGLAVVGDGLPETLRNILGAALNGGALKPGG